MPKRRIVLDLHPMYNKGEEIDIALKNSVKHALDIKAPTLEIICGKGSGQLKKKVLRFLQRKDIRITYHRIEKDSRNFGRLFVHFRHK